MEVGAGDLTIRHVGAETRVDLGERSLPKSTYLVAKKLNEMKPFQKKIYELSKALTNRFVELQTEDGPILLKISEITNKLGISKKQLLKSNSEGNLKELLL